MLPPQLLPWRWLHDRIDTLMRRPAGRVRACCVISRQCLNRMRRRTNGGRKRCRGSSDDIIPLCIGCACVRSVSDAHGRMEWWCQRVPCQNVSVADDDFGASAAYRMVVEGRMRYHFTGISNHFLHTTHDLLASRDVDSLTADLLDYGC